jgi:hypothetical protein
LTADILIALVIGQNIGRRARLTVWTTSEIGVVQDGSLLTDQKFDNSVLRAKHDACRLLGSPSLESGFRWTIRRLPRDVVEVPNLCDNSLYGAFTLTFLQLISKTSSYRQMDAAGSQTLALLPAIQGASLSRVAVSTGPTDCDLDCCSGVFKPIDGIREKLRILATLQDNDLMTCILSKHQVIPANVFQPENDGRVLREVPIIDAHDAVDAFGKLFELQIRNTVRRYV